MKCPIDIYAWFPLGKNCREQVTVTDVRENFTRLRSTMTDLSTENKDKFTCGLFPIGENDLFTTMMTMVLLYSLYIMGRLATGPY